MTAGARIPLRLVIGLAVAAARDAIEQLALRDWVWAALEDLPEPLRLVTLLRFFGPGHPYAQIAQLWHFVSFLSFLHFTAQLRKSDNRHLQFLGEPLQIARNAADLLFAVPVFVVAAARHELEIVDDDESEILKAYLRL